MKVGTISYKVLALYVLLATSWVLLPYNFLKYSFEDYESYRTFFTVRIIFLAMTGFFIFILVRYLEKKLVVRLNEANQNLNIFLYKTHHDIRGPVKTLLGLSHIAKTSFPSGDSKECIDKISVVSQKMDKLINRLVHLSQIHEGEDANRLIDCHKLVHESLNQINTLLQPAPVEVTMEMSAGAGFYGDYSLIQTVFYCLLENSFVFQKRDASERKINIRLTCDESYGHFTIADNGIGMDEKTLDKAFNMFYRGSMQSVGSGLGLYLVKKTLEKINGSIYIQSACSEGTTISITIPNRHPAKSELPGTPV
jgi:hypothetical protein